MRNPLRFCTAPWLTMTSAPMTDSGTNTRTRDRVRSDQKLPIVAVRPAIPRTTASATASPTPAAVNCATTSPAVSARLLAAVSPSYACQLVPVTKLTAVLNESSGGMPGACVGFPGSTPCSRRMAYSSRLDISPKASTASA